MGMLHYSVQLHDERTGAAITQSGGAVIVCQSGDASKQTLYTKAGLAASNPVAITYGKIEFWVADTATQVDLYGIGPNGESIRLAGVKPGGDAAYFVNTALMQVYKIPFSYADQAGDATETDTGLDFVTNTIVHGLGLGLLVTVADATETIDFGGKTSESGDPDGFLDLVSVASAVMVKPTLANGTPTLGALLFVQDSANAGDEAPESHVVVSTARSITYTLSAGADTAKGFGIFPVTLPA
ncbi:hypothetical protein [Ferrovibrio terrae]|uniref:hypothetical protein n=1 Tax=Ferrovibrio terrae TaxID=2594003 RepID=UPI00313815C0